MHASAVAFGSEGRNSESKWSGVLILGRSGSGKSELALELIALGAHLVADDQTELNREGRTLWLRPPEQIKGMIELRRVGILRASALDRAPLALVVDLDATETARLPQQHWIELSGLAFPLLKNAPGRAFAIGLKHYLLARPWRDEEGLHAPAPKHV